MRVKRTGWSWPYLCYIYLLKMKNSLYKDIRKRSNFKAKLFPCLLYKLIVYGPKKKYQTEMSR